MMRENKYYIEGQLEIIEERDPHLDNGCTQFIVSLKSATINKHHQLHHDLSKFTVSADTKSLAVSEFFQRWTQYTKRRFNQFVYLNATFIHN